MSGAEAPPNSVGIVIDVSKYQTSLPPLSGVLGVIARAGIGTKPDATFVDHIHDAKAAGKFTGSYWFNWGTLSISDQVDAYIAMEKAVGGVDLHVLDWEGDASYDFSPAQATQFMTLYRQRTGFPIALYASQSRFRDLGQDWNWIAFYSQNPPTKRWDMWQYGSYLGVDGNYATQRILDLVKEAQMTALAVTDTTPKNIQRTPTWYNLDGTVDSTGHSTGVSYSPYGTAGGYRAFVAGTVLMLNKPSAVVDVPDASPYTQAQMDAATKAATAAQKQADQAALDAAAKQHADDQVALAKAQADLQTAAANERERIAVSLGQDAAQKVRNT